MRYTSSSWDGVKKEIIECSTVKPSLSVFFTVGNEGSLSQSMFDYRSIHEILLLKVF